MSAEQARAVPSNMQAELKHKRQLYKFLSEPKDFHGTSDRNPLSWLRHLDRIRRGLELKDEEILLVASTHFQGQAELWWDTVEDEVKTWMQFKEAFRKQFAESLQDRWWSELETMEQEDDQSVDDVALSIQELCRLLDIKDKNYHIRCLLRAMKPEIGFELEKSGVTADWDKVIKAARQVEVVMNKYSKSGYTVPTKRTTGIDSTRSLSSKSSEKDGKSDYDVASIGSSLDELVSGMRALKINLVDKPPRTKPPTRGPIRCFLCHQEGHKSYECPENKPGKVNGHQ